MFPIFRSKLTTALLAILAVWMLVLAVGATLRARSVASQADELRVQTASAQRENKRLADQVERMQYPQWLALLARQRLNYKLPDETVVFVYKSEKSDIISQSQATLPDDRPNWRRWWDWLWRR